MERSEDEILGHLARKYIWWKSPDEAMRTPQGVIAQVMNLGDYDDVQIMANWLTSAKSRPFRQGSCLDS